MIRAVLVCAVVFGSVYGFQEMGKINTNQHVFFLQQKFYYTATTDFGFQVEFPQATQQVLLMAFQSWKVDQNMTKYQSMNCGQLKAESTWYRVLSSCSVTPDDKYGAVIKCTGEFQFKAKPEEMYMDYKFAFAVCEGQDLHITSYDLTANPWKYPVSAAATSVHFSFIILFLAAIFVL